MHLPFAVLLSLLATLALMACGQSDATGANGQDIGNPPFGTRTATPNTGDAGDSGESPTASDVAEGPGDAAESGDLPPAPDIVDSSGEPPTAPDATEDTTEGDEDTDDGPPALPAFHKSKLHPDYDDNWQQEIEGELPPELDGLTPAYYAEVWAFPERQPYMRYPSEFSISSEGVVNFSGVNVDLPPWTGELHTRDFATPVPTLCTGDAFIDVEIPDAFFGRDPAMYEASPQTYQYDDKAISVMETNKIQIPNVTYSSSSAITEEIDIFQDPTGRAALVPPYVQVEVGGAFTTQDKPTDKSKFYVRYEMTPQDNVVNLLVGRGPNYPDASFDGERIWVSRRLVSESCSTVILYKFKVVGTQHSGTASLSVSMMEAGTEQDPILVPPKNTLSLGDFDWGTSFPGGGQWNELVKTIGPHPAFCDWVNDEPQPTGAGLIIYWNHSPDPSLTIKDMYEDIALQLGFRTYYSWGGDRWIRTDYRIYLKGGEGGCGPP